MAVISGDAAADLDGGVSTKVRNSSVGGSFSRLADGVVPRRSRWWRPIWLGVFGVMVAVVLAGLDAVRGLM